jgi:predicted small secreted protein
MVIALKYWEPIRRQTLSYATSHTEKGCAMRQRLTLALTLLTLAAATPLLGACHTTAGAGQDISATGNAIDQTAKKATP